MLVFLIAAASLALAIPPSRLSLSEYQKQDWQVEDGLPVNNVRMIAQRWDGSLLLATSAGISSFDGLHFRSALKSDDAEGEAVNAVVPVSNTEMWIGTDGRGVLYQTASRTVNISEQAGFYNERVRMLHLDSSGVLWIATQNGIERYVNGSLEKISGVGMLTGDLISPFAEDGSGGMFFVTSAGLFHWQNGVTEHYALPLAPSDVPVAAYRDPEHHIWIGTMRHLVQLTQQEATKQFYPRVRAMLSGPISTMIADAQQNLWIGTRRDGLWRFSDDGLARWTSKNGMADDAIRSLFIDDEQNLWIGMLTGGLSRWRKGALAPYGDPEGFHATYSANVLADSHGDLWLGTWDKGLFRRHNGHLASVNPPAMPLTTPIRSLAEDGHGQIWVGTWFNGLYRYDGQSFHHYLLGNESPGNAVSVIVPAHTGGLWVGTYTGLFFFPSGEPDLRNRLHLLDSQLVTSMLEDRDGSLLVGTSTGLYRVRNGAVKAIPEFGHANILSLTLDNSGYVWVGAKGGGLYAIHGTHTTRIPTTAGLPNVNITSGIEDRDGHLWFGSSRGIVRVPRADLLAVAEGRRSTLSSVILDRADGMRSSECSGPSKPASTLAPDGSLWFVTSKGFVRTTDVAERLGTTSPTAVIVGWTPSIDQNTADLAPTLSNTSIDLEAGHSDILIFFNAKLLSNPTHIEFRYRLTGYDSTWTMTRARIARYRRLAPGSYTFEVQARGSGEEWSTQIASMKVRQRPYFYQTWYFYLAAVLFAAALLVHLFRLRVRAIKGHMGIVLEERSRIARECHDTLMAGFAAISWQLEATAKLFRDTNAESTPPAKSCELARSMVTHCQAEARRIIWDLRDTDEVTNVLSHALTRSLSANIAPANIQTSFDVDGDELPLAPGCVHHLVCIGQEAVSNAIRHAGASLISIHLKYEADFLTLSIRDDGCGFDKSNAERVGHFGIPVMEERAHKLGGALRLQSEVGAGTEVAVKVPFNAMQYPVNREHRVIRWIGI